MEAYNTEYRKALSLTSVKWLQKGGLGEGLGSKRGSECRTRSGDERLTIIHSGVKNIINPNWTTKNSKKG